MSALLLCLVLAQAPGDEPGGFYWPLGSGERAYDLRATYGQIEGGTSGTQAGDRLHLGTDVIARKRREEVYAIETGRVVRVDASDPYLSHVLIESKAIRGRAFLYLHLDPASIQVAVGDPVEADAYIADVVLSDPHTGVRHLHLSRIEKASGGVWVAKSKWSIRNPLALIDPKYLGDSQAPVFESIGGTRDVRVAVRSDEATPSSPYLKPLDALPAGKLDVLVRLHDSDRTSPVHLLAPYRLLLAIQESGGALVEHHEILFDGRLQGLLAGDAYNLASPCMSVGTSTPLDYDYYFVPTNGGSKPAKANHWDATPGAYRLNITATDVAGNAAPVLQQDVVVN